MSSNDIALRVENLGKMYRLGREVPHASSIGGKIKQVVAAPFGWLASQMREPSKEEILWALKDVSFEVKRGEVVGVIGSNGAGKSTLLKLLSRITEPTEGFAEIHGRVGALLEVGTGMHPELTGRENVYMNGTVIGMRKREIDAKFDEIVGFSGIEKFLDTPVKRFSSGMRVRLGFAIAAHLEPEILIVDEVLAVGDADFRQKCLGKMEDVARQGRTVLFVSHSMTAVRSLCSRVLRLENGGIIDQGDTEEVVDAYLRDNATANYEMEWHDQNEAPGNHRARIKRMRLSFEGSEKGRLPYTTTPLRVDYEFWNLEEQKVNISTHLTTPDGMVIFNVWSECVVMTAGVVRGTMQIPGGFLNDGFYRLDFQVVSNGITPAHLKPGIAFEIYDNREDEKWLGKVRGAVRPSFLTFPLESSASV